MTNRQDHRNNDENWNIARKKLIFFLEFSVAMTAVDSFACFHVIFLEKQRVMRLPSQKKKLSTEVGTRYFKSTDVTFAATWLKK